MFWHHSLHGPVEVAFTSRDGGVSAGPHGSLDLGNANSSDPDDVRENRTRVAEALGVSHLHAMSQVHGSAVLDAASTATDEPECDALVSATPGTALLVRVADCVPVVLADPGRGVVGVAHAGRAGMVAGVVTRAVERMHELGAAQVQAWLGPRACGRCYELPEQLVAEIDAIEPGTRSTTSWGTPAVDVARGVVQQLERSEAVVHDLAADTCTIEHDRWFSHRRQGVQAGRLGGLVVLR